MKVLHVIEGISPNAGGPTRSVRGLTAALAQQGVTVALFAHSPLHDWLNAAPVLFQKGTVSDGSKTLRELKEMIQDFHPDIIHLHGLWTNHGDVRIARKLKIPIVLSPRGMLDPWALSVKKWKKRFAMVLYQRRDLRNVSAFHATAELEAANIRAQGLTQPIIISPNGVDVPVEVKNAFHKSFTSNSGNRVAIFMGRLHPGKGLITLAEAWARIKPKGWVMRVVGPDGSGHKAEVITRLEKLGISYSDVKSRISLDHPNNSTVRTSWEFVDIVDDKIKWLEYAAADLLVHPSVSENFGITIAEGLATGLPVISTKGTPWSDLEAAKCGRWIDIGVEPLVAALKEMMSMTDGDRRQMGEQGRKLVDEKYTWAAVVKPLLLGYKKVLEDFGS